MRQTKSYADERQLSWCAHCGGPTASIDHIPAKVFLDKPYPDQLITVLSCKSCNEGHSLDEEYLACVIECIVAGSADLTRISRDKIRRLLTDKPALVARIERGRSERNNQTLFEIEVDRVRRVVLKIASGLALYELGEPQFGKRAETFIFPLISLSPEQRRHFESYPDIQVWPEVGSRAMQRLAAPSLSENGWITVQEGNYRYLAAYNGCSIVRMVFREYLGCETFFHDD